MSLEMLSTVKGAVGSQPQRGDLSFVSSRRRTFVRTPSIFPPSLSLEAAVAAMRRCKVCAGGGPVLSAKSGVLRAKCSPYPSITHATSRRVGSFVLRSAYPLSSPNPANVVNHSQIANGKPAPASFPIFFSRIFRHTESLLMQHSLADYVY